MDIWRDPIYTIKTTKLFMQDQLYYLQVKHNVLA